MKKSKLLLSSFCLALALTFSVATAGSVYADDGGPQGGSNSKKQPPPPPPPTSTTLDQLIAWLASMFIL